MSDTALNRILSFGPDADRLAFVPDPPTPAAGADLAYLWFTSDTLALWTYDFGASDWVEITGGGGGATMSGAGVSIASDVSISNNANTAVAWDTQDYDVGSYWAIGNATKFVVPATAYYSLKASIEFASNATSIRFIGFRVNAGATYLAAVQLGASPSGGTCMSMAIDAKLTAADYVEVIVYQASGGSLNLTAGNGRSRMTIHKIADV